MCKTKLIKHNIAILRTASGRSGCPPSIVLAAVDFSWCKCFCYSEYGALIHPSDVQRIVFVCAGKVQPQTCCCRRLRHMLGGRAFLLRMLHSSISRLRCQQVGFGWQCRVHLEGFSRHPRCVCDSPYPGVKGWESPSSSTLTSIWRQETYDDNVPCATTTSLAFVSECHRASRVASFFLAFVTFRRLSLATCPLELIHRNNS